MYIRIYIDDLRTEIMSSDYIEIVNVMITSKTA